MNQYMIPGIGVFNEEAARQYSIPSFGLVLDPTAAGPAVIGPAGAIATGFAAGTPMMRGTIQSEVV